MNQAQGQSAKHPVVSERMTIQRKQEEKVLLFRMGYGTSEATNRKDFLVVSLIPFNEGQN